MENKNIFSNIADMQKQAMENFTSLAENMQKSFFNVNLDSEFFKKWYDSQMEWFNKNTNNQTNMDFFNNWMNMQFEMAKQWMNFGSNMMKSMTQNNGSDNNAYSNMMAMFNNWIAAMNHTYSEMLKNMNNGSGKTAFERMFYNAEMYMKAFELWMPVMKAMSEKTFMPENFSKLFNANMFKEMIDKMFGMQPEFFQNMTNQMMETMKNSMGNMMDNNKNMFDNMKNMMNHMMPNGSDMVGNMLNMYNNWYASLHQAAAPIMKLMPNGTMKHNMQTMQDMMNQMAVFNFKNAQLQYVMYQTAMKASEELSEELYAKMRNGEEMDNFLKVYQNWLNKLDKHFVKLFETNEYSKMMAETSAMQLKLKKQFESMMEKAMSHLPLINRSEMDDLYKTIHELKNRVHALEKQLESDEIVAEEEVKETKTAGKKASKNA